MTTGNAPTAPLETATSTASVGTPVTAASEPPVPLMSAALNDSDALTITVRNDGPARSVTGVQIQEVTTGNRTRLVEDAGLTGLASGTLWLDLGKADATEIIDGPDGVTGLTLDETGTVLPASAPEGGPPVSVPSAVSNREIASGETVTLQFITDQDMTATTGDGALEDGDSTRFSVTVTYSDGHRETYDVHIETPDDDER